MTFIISSQIGRAIRLHERFKNALSGQYRKEVKPFYGLRARYFSDYWHEAAVAINGTITDVGYGYFQISKNGRSTYVHQSDVMLDDHLSLRLAGNKPFIHKLLQQHQLPVPRYHEFDLSSLDSAVDFMSTLDKNVVVKPAGGTGAGWGVTTNIRSQQTLKKAAIKATIYGNKLLVEEQVLGNSYRLIYLNGKLIDAIRRDPPVVIGDGTHSIRELISLENQTRLSAQGIISLNPITIDMECQQHLKEQGYSLQTVPDTGREIVIKKVVNQNSNKQNHSVLKEVHDSFHDLGNKINSFFKLELSGLDLITSDITRPLSESGGVINEINTTPGLHHHSLICKPSERVPVPELILEYILTK